MLKKIHKISFALMVVSLPVFAFAEPLGGTKTLFENAQGIITKTVIPLAFVLALLFFFWGVAKYIRSSGTEKDEGKKIMVWGVVALFVMSSVWGIVRFLQGELIEGVKTDAIDIPTINTGP